MQMTSEIVSVKAIAQVIYLVRGQRVLLDRDLAALYGVETRVLNQAVKRNANRFPEDFMLRLSRQEIARISQSVTSLSGLKFSKQVHAFTEEGVAMLSSVLNSERAVQVNIAIMRAFVKLRGILETNRELARKFDELEARVGKHDEQIGSIIEAIRQLMAPPEKPRREWSGGAAATWPVEPRRIAGEPSGSGRDTNRVSCSRKSNAPIWRAKEELTHGRRRPLISALVIRRSMLDVGRVKRRGRHAPLRRWAFSAPEYHRSSFLLLFGYCTKQDKHGHDMRLREWQLPQNPSSVS
jgi:hypothetical protein